MLAQLKPEKIHLFVREIDKYAQTINDSDKTKVLIVGDHGSGKSSLLNALVQNELQIEKNFNRVVLDGRGVCHNFPTSYRPNIEIDNESNLIFCECPHIFNDNWYISSVINSYIIHKVLMKSKNKENKIKIILVMISEDILCCRRALFNDHVKYLGKIFPNNQTLMENTAIVISKCYKSYMNKDIFIDVIEERSLYPDHRETQNWYHYLLQNMNQIFFFSSPSSKDVGKLYQFKQRDELIEFLKKDPLVNPEIKYISCEKSLNMACSLATAHSDLVTKVIDELFNKINTKIQKERNLDKINKLINSMNAIISTKFNSYEDISRILREQIQNEQEYETYYQQISEFHEFYSFLNDYISYNYIEKKVTIELQSLASQTLTELQKFSNS